MKQISLKNLKWNRDLLNERIENDNKERYYITRYDHDIETNEQILTINRIPLYAQKRNANWSYFLVFGRPRNNND